MRVFRLHSSSITPAAYGGPTEVIEMIIRSAESLQWLGPVEPESRRFVSALVEQHITDLNRIVCEPALEHLQVDFISGDWAKLASKYTLVNPTDADSEATPGIWRRSVSTVMRHLQDDLRRSEHLSSLLRAPLFPVSGNPMVLGGMITNAADGVEEVEPASREMVWSMMCEIDRDFWAAILWQLVHRDNGSEKPFIPLLETYQRNFYPLGVIDDQFIVFHRG